MYRLPFHAGIKNWVSIYLTLKLTSPATANSVKQVDATIKRYIPFESSRKRAFKNPEKNKNNARLLIFIIKCNHMHNIDEI